MQHSVEPQEGDVSQHIASLFRGRIIIFMSYDIVSFEMRGMFDIQWQSTVLSDIAQKAV